MKRLIALTILTLPLATASAQGAGEWKIHSMERPLPPVVHPGGAAVVAPPADAVVLFDGRTMEGWQSTRDSSAAPWLMADGVLEVVPGTGGIETKARFGDVQLHVEWMAPVPAEGNGQNRGNSGIFLMGRYEVQVLDSWENLTYPDGQAGSVYGQYPPLVNASLPPGSWQSYDIIFRRPRFDSTGKVITPARMTVLHNGVLVQQNVALLGPTSHQVRAPYEAHADRLPLSLQDHGQAVRFRNIWIRAIGERQ